MKILVEYKINFDLKNEDSRVAGGVCEFSEYFEIERITNSAYKKKFEVRTLDYKLIVYSKINSKIKIYPFVLL